MKRSPPNPQQRAQNVNSTKPPSHTLPDVSDTPLDVSTWPRWRPRYERQFDETIIVGLPYTPAFAHLQQYEWVSFGMNESCLLLGWAPAARGVVLVDDSGERTLVYDCDAISLMSPKDLPVCWFALPDRAVMQQLPLAPRALDLGDFHDSVETWRETVTDCLRFFDNNEDDVDHFIYGREHLAWLSGEHPVLTLQPEWRDVLNLDVQFRACAEQAWQVARDGPVPPWTQAYAAWWQRAGWLLYAAIQRDLAPTPRGIAQAKNIDAAVAASLRFFMPHWDMSVFDNPVYLNTIAELPLGTWVMDTHFGAGIVVRHEKRFATCEQVIICYCIKGWTLVSLSEAKLVKWRPTTHEQERHLLQTLGVSGESISTKSFYVCSVELAYAISDNSWPIDWV